MVILDGGDNDVDDDRDDWQFTLKNIIQGSM